jgi:hypothetical protein
MRLERISVCPDGSDIAILGQQKLNCGELPGAVIVAAFTECMISSAEMAMQILRRSHSYLYFGSAATHALLGKLRRIQDFGCSA